MVAASGLWVRGRGGAVRVRCRHHEKPGEPSASRAGGDVMDEPLPLSLDVRIASVQITALAALLLRKGLITWAEWEVEVLKAAANTRLTHPVSGP